MEILKSPVKDEGYPPVPDVYYGKVDEKTIYYFIPNGKMENGNIIVSTNLKEAIGHAPHTSLGYIDPNGNVLIPCENKTLKQVGNKEDNILLAEKNTPTSESVLAIIKSMNNPANQQAIEENGKNIKDQMIQAMGMSGDFIFDNQCSEAALYTMDGLNVSNGYYSFISELNSNYYFATNVPGQQILTFNPSMLKPQEREVQQVEQEAMPNIDIPIQQQVQNDEVANGQEINMPPQVEPEVAGQVGQATATESPNQVDASSTNNVQAEESSNQITEFQNKELNDSSSQEEEEMPAQGESDDDEIEAKVKEDEIVAEAESDDAEVETEAEEDEIADEAESDDAEIEADAEEDEIKDEAELDDDDEIEAKEEETAAEAESDSDEIKADAEEELAKIIEFPKSHKLTEEDFSTPVIRDATQTIINIVAANGDLRKELDRLKGQIIILESNLGILNEDARAKDEETRVLRQELEQERQEKASYKSQAAESNRKVAESNRKVIKLSAALERQIDIDKDKDRQIEELSRQVAGLSNLNNAVMEANALVQPVDNSSEDNMIYGDFTYLGNAKSKGKVA